MTGHAERHDSFSPMQSTRTSDCVSLSLTLPNLLGEVKVCDAGSKPSRHLELNICHLKTPLCVTVKKKEGRKIGVGFLKC